MKKKPVFHLVDPSPWPIVTSLTICGTAIGLAFFMHRANYGIYILIISLLLLLTSLFFWWRDVISESAAGYHSREVQKGLKIGMLVFFLSEICLFGSFFATYFFSSINPIIIENIWTIGSSTWPPEGIKKINAWDVPFINTLILLLSSCSVTWAISAIAEKDQKSASLAFLITVLLGITFVLFQIYEYYHAKFSMKDGIYGSNFYLITGFHGLHVIIGIIFLFVCYLRSKRGDFNKSKYLGAEFAAWYWHFVDVIWLFLFVFVYIIV